MGYKLYIFMLDVEETPSSSFCQFDEAYFQNYDKVSFCCQNGLLRVIIRVRNKDFQEKMLSSKKNSG